MHKHITVYQTDRDGIYLYETVAHELGLDEDVYNVPYGAYTESPPPAPAGSVARRVGDAWETVEDYRAVALWVVATRAPYGLGAKEVVAGQELIYPGWGPLPTWLTDIEPEQARSEVADE
jgi:hypothetical protein